MPLHDWAELKGWDGFHHLWMGDIYRDLKGNLPPGYRAVIGSNPLVTAPALSGKPDVLVAAAPPRRPGPAGPSRAVPEPDYEVEVMFTPNEDEEVTLTVTYEAVVVAVIELISPRNKDRPSSRRHYGRRYADYLYSGINLLLVDVHRRPATFSFPHYIAAARGISAPPLSAPSAVSYGLSFPAASGGRMVDIWQRPLAAGQPLPAIPLALLGDDRVSVDLNGTYSRAAADSYLE